MFYNSLLDISLVSQELLATESAQISLALIDI
jgi:hypothetical protein